MKKHIKIFILIIISIIIFFLTSTIVKKLSSDSTGSGSGNTTPDSPPDSPDDPPISCNDSEIYIEKLKKCCPKDKTIGDICCEDNESIVNGRCCPKDKIAGDICCEDNESIVDGKCCPKDKVAGDSCCEDNESIVDGKCCPKDKVANDKCCSFDETPISGECCPNNQIANNICCSSDEKATASGKCCPINKFNPNTKECCETMYDENNKNCCSKDQMLKDGSCCPSERYNSETKECCPVNRFINGKCCPDKQTNYDNNTCCPDNYVYSKNSKKCCELSKYNNITNNCCNDDEIYDDELKTCVHLCPDSKTKCLSDENCSSYLDKDNNTKYFCLNNSCKTNVKITYTPNLNLEGKDIPVCQKKNKLPDDPYITCSGADVNVDTLYERSGSAQIETSDDCGINLCKFVMSRENVENNIDSDVFLDGNNCSANFICSKSKDISQDCVAPDLTDKNHLCFNPDGSYSGKICGPNDYCLNQKCCPKEKAMSPSGQFCKTCCQGDQICVTVLQDGKETPVCCHPDKYASVDKKCCAENENVINGKCTVKCGNTNCNIYDNQICEENTLSSGLTKGICTSGFDCTARSSDETLPTLVNSQVNVCGKFDINNPSILLENEPLSTCHTNSDQATYSKTLTQVFSDKCNEADCYNHFKENSGITKIHFITNYDGAGNNKCVATIDCSKDTSLDSCTTCQVADNSCCKFSDGSYAGKVCAKGLDCLGDGTTDNPHRCGTDCTGYFNQSIRTGGIFRGFKQTGNGFKCDDPRNKNVPNYDIDEDEATGYGCNSDFVNNKCKI